MVNFLCVGCGANLRIGDEWSGKLGRCPHCGSVSQVPGSLKRTSRRTILARFFAWPVIVLSFWSFFLGWSLFLGGIVAVAIGLFFCWVFTNVGAFLYHPGYYRLIKAGGGDPWFDTLDPPLNNDPESVRYQEMFCEKARQESERIERLFGFPQPNNDATKGIDDPDVI